MTAAKATNRSRNVFVRVLLFVSITVISGVLAVSLLAANREPRFGEPGLTHHYFSYTSSSAMLVNCAEPPGLPMIRMPVVLTGLKVISNRLRAVTAVLRRGDLRRRCSSCLGRHPLVLIVEELDVQRFKPAAVGRAFAGTEHQSADLDRLGPRVAVEVFSSAYSCRRSSRIRC